MELDPNSLPTKLFKEILKMRCMYSEKIEEYIKTDWFCDRIYGYITRNNLGSMGYLSDDKNEREAQLQAATKARDFMRDFCRMSESDVESILVSKSTLDAANYSIKFKNERLASEAEKLFLERCKSKKSRLNALLMYCGKWDIMPENMTEITIIAGFEGGRRGEKGKEFMKKLAVNKRKCKELLAQIMKLEGIAENEPISKIMERLET